MTRYHVTLTTPEAVARQLNTVNPDGSVPAVIQDAASGQYVNFWSYVTDLCHEASEYITQETSRSFVPFKADYDIVWDDVKYDIRRGRLPLGDDLLVPSSLAFGDLAISGTAYRVLPSSETPINALVLDSTAMTGAVYEFGSAFTVSGIWGYVTNLSQAWTVMQSSINIASSSTTSINVTIGTADNYEHLQYLRCESEYMQIVDIDTETDVLTVLRGVNGTTAATHGSAALERFNVKEDIRLAATRLTAYLYQKRTDVSGSIAFNDGSILLDALPLVVKSTINRYKPMVFRSTTGYRW